ncbi:MAG: hypothetical protein RUMPE_00287 [Eubacteriales bacterium SKADARSKE-1]|nr:hypothetical protein [Eubacteriales bacterium SKADARSKE-1]
MNNILKGLIHNDEKSNISINSQLFQDEINSVSSQMACVDTWFQMEEDQDLVEACIYQKESLAARYRYLIKKAKESHISLSPFNKSV